MVTKHKHLGCWLHNAYLVDKSGIFVVHPSTSLCVLRFAILRQIC